jgi:hypothetical protein
MLQFLQRLESRMCFANEEIYQELDDVREILFFHTGSVDLGYEINKKKIFKLRLKEPNVLGAFYVSFSRKAMFITKAYTQCEGFSIRTDNWVQILSDAPDVARAFKPKILMDFYREVRKPMLVQKNRDIKNICRNSKWDKSLYNEVDMKKNDFYEILKETADSLKNVITNTEKSQLEIEILEQ